MLVKIFYEIDEFCKQYERQLKHNALTNGSAKRIRKFKLTLSEVMTISLYYHDSGFRTFKDYYEKYVLRHMKSEFLNLVSYNRFIELRQKALLPLWIFLQLNAIKSCTGISFIDSLALKVCHIKREYSHKVFKGLAKKGKTSVGWFYGFKVHLIINPLGEILAFYITPGNVADNNPSLLLKLTNKIFGKLFGDRGYLVNEELFTKLYQNGVQLVTKIRKNMKNKLMLLEDKLLLTKRGLIESVGNILKNSLNLEHTRHRSPLGLFCHILTTLVAYHFRPNKPSILVPLTLP